MKVSLPAHKDPQREDTAVVNLIELKRIEKTYNSESEENAVYAVRPTDLVFEKGLFAAIMGPSGSGKSTLLNLLGLLDTPSSGEFILDNQNVADLSDDARSAMRCHKIGIVFQSFNLFPQFSLLENVCVPMRYAGARPDDITERAEALLEKLGLEDRLTHKPTELSGGQRQRAAIARALANDPPLVLADEPTGNLDEHTGNDVINIFRELAADGRTVIMVTHNPEYKAVVERVIELHDGHVTVT